MHDHQAAQLLVLLGQYTEEYYGGEPDSITVRTLVDDLAETLPSGDVLRLGKRSGRVIQAGSVLKEEIENAIYQCRIWR